MDAIRKIETTDIAKLVQNLVLADRLMQQQGLILGDRYEKLNKPLRAARVALDEALTANTQTLASKEAELVRLQQELNVASVGEFAAQSASRHLSALLDVERQITERCMAVMKALMDAAEPVNNEFQDCHIDYAEYAKFVDAHAELLYVIKNGERPAITQPPKEPT